MSGGARAGERRGAAARTMSEHELGIGIARDPRPNGMEHIMYIIIKKTVVMCGV